MPLIDVAHTDDANQYARLRVRYTCEICQTVNRTNAGFEHPV